MIKHIAWAYNWFGGPYVRPNCLYLAAMAEKIFRYLYS